MWPSASCLNEIRALLPVWHFYLESRALVNSIELDILSSITVIFSVDGILLAVLIQFHGHVMIEIRAFNTGLRLIANAI